MAGLIDDKDKNRFTRQLEINPSGTNGLYFMLSAGDTYGADIYGDVQIFSFVSINSVAIAVGSRYEGGSYFLSANGQLTNSDFGTTSASVHENGSQLTVTVQSYSMYGIMEILFTNANATDIMTVVTNIEFQNVMYDAYMVEVPDPPSLP